MATVNNSSRLEALLSTTVSTSFADLLDRTDVGAFDALIQQQAVSGQLTRYIFDGPASIGAQPWDDLKASFDFKLHDMALSTRRYALESNVDRDDINDMNVIDVAGRIGKKLADAARAVPQDIFLETVLAASSSIGWDGAPVLGVHNLGGANYTNLTWSTALTAANFDVAMDTFGNITMKGNQSIGDYTPTHIIAHRSKRSALKGILDRADIALDGVSVENFNYKVVTPILTNHIPSDMWILVDANATPFILAVKDPPRMVSQTEGSDYAYYYGRYSYSMECNMGGLIPDFGAIAVYRGIAAPA